MKIELLNSDELELVYAIEQRAHEFPDSLPLFLSHHGVLYFNLKITAHLSPTQAPKTVGFLISQLVCDEATLFDIAIVPEYQHQGLGEQLLRAWIEKLRTKNVARLFLEARISNLNAIKLYQKIGFKQIAIRKNYYPAKNDREDAIVMKYDLK